MLLRQQIISKMICAKRYIYGAWVKGEGEGGGDLLSGGWFC